MIFHNILDLTFWAWLDQTVERLANADLKASDPARNPQPFRFWTNETKPEGRGSCENP